MSRIALRARLVPGAAAALLLTACASTVALPPLTPGHPAHPAAALAPAAPPTFLEETPATLPLAPEPSPAGHTGHHH